LEFIIRFSAGYTGIFTTLVMGWFACFALVLEKEGQMGIMWLEYNTTQVIENIYSHALFIKIMHMTIYFTKVIINI
jgi:hypothetical protein